MKSNRTMTSGEGLSLICGMGRTPVSRKEIDKWCERSTAKPQKAHRAA